MKSIHIRIGTERNVERVESRGMVQDGIGSEKVEGIKREITCRRQKTGRSKGNFMFGHGKYLICAAEIIMRTG